MALTDFGAVPASSVLPIYFTSHDAATGANEAASNLAVGDILIYKGTSITQRSSTSGFALIDTDGLNVDGLTGVNAISIDLSDNTDAGFYAVGSFYNVVLGPITIDAQTVYTHLATFRIVAAEGVTGKPKVDVDAFGGTAGTFSSGRPEVNTTHAAGTAWGSGAITASSIASDAITAAKVADGTIDAATFAAGAITASAIAADAIGASELAADAATEIATAVWAAATRTLTALGFTLGASDLAADTITDAKVASDVTIASVTGAVGSVTGAVGSVTGAVGSVGAGGITAASIATDAIDADALAADALTEIFTKVFTTAITEAYSADGAAPTLAQFMMLVQQALTEFAISSTTLTIKKLDGSTTAATLTLDSATTPTSATRTT